MSMAKKLSHLPSGYQTILNIICNIVSVVMGALISFFLTPYIVSKIGIEAHGFIGLSTNIISYISLGAIAINTVSSRFVAISYHSGDLNRASELYTATIVGNIISILMISIPSMVLIVFVEKFINVPLRLLTDLKLLLTLLLFSFIISTLFNHWSIAPFIKNLLFLNSLRDVLSGLLRALALIVLFSFFDAKMCFMGVGAMVATIASTIYSAYFHRQLLPEIRFERQRGIMADVKLLVSSGIWNVINTGGVLLLNGLDLLLANTFLGPEEMGNISVSKVVPTMLITLVGTLPTMFAPVLTRHYAQKDMGGVAQHVHYANRLSSFIIGVPIYGFLIYSYDFYLLWMKGENAVLLSQLSFLTLLPMVLLGGVNSVYVLFTVANKLKTNAILVLTSGILSTIGVLFFLKYSNFGVYAIVGISAISVIGRQLLYALPYSARTINQKPMSFYRDIVYILKVGFITLIVGVTVKAIISSETWFSFFCSILLTGGLAYTLSVFMIFDKHERHKLLESIKSIRKRRDKET